MPSASVRGGTTVPCVTTAPAPTIASSPITAPSRTMAPMPTSAPSSTVAPCSTARWPTVTPAANRHGWAASVWMTTRSCTLLRGPTVIGATSARRTQPNQTLASASTMTWPTRVAVGAT